jgi:hypothetical protein
MAHESTIGAFPVAAQRGRDHCDAIRDAIQLAEMRGKRVQEVWINQDTADAMHALYSFIAKRYDLKLPQKLAGVPLRVGMTGGQDVVLIYEEDTQRVIAQEEAKSDWDKKRGAAIDAGVVPVTDKIHIA